MTEFGIPATPFPFRLLAAAEAVATARTPVLSRENHEQLVLEYITGGRGFLEINGRSFEPEAGGIYFLTKGSSHRYWPDRNQPWEKIFFAVDGDLADELMRIYELAELYWLPDCPALRHYFETLLDLSCNTEETDRRAAVVFHQLLEECSRLQRSKQAAVRPEIAALRRYLDLHGEEKFQLSAYAENAGFSSAHLIRQFQHAYGQSPYDYFMNRKIEIARNLLRYTNLSVKEIAFRLNFSDQYYFSTYFKRRTGTSPSRFS